MTLTRRAALAALAVVGLAAAPAVAQTTITIQHPLPPSSHYGAGAAALKESFERATGGRFRVNIFSQGGNFSIVDYLIWNEIPVVLGNLVGGLAFTGLTLYATHIKTGPKRKLA